jgi:hypothetical protein
MTYTFEILRIVTEKQTAESDEVVQNIKYSIHGTNDASPAQTASHLDILKLQDSSPQVLWSDSMSESDAIAIVRTKYDNDADFRTTVNDSIAASIVASQPITRVMLSEDLPWNS